jgi:L-2,4-diaminobutyric acid acetyltransferase
MQADPLLTTRRLMKAAGDAWNMTGTDVGIMLRKPRVEDGPQIHALVDRCKPLDLNSLYSYLLLCHHFADTCVVGEKDGRIVSFVSAYQPPTQPDVLFIWQVAVDAEARGCGLAKKMLIEILGRDTASAATALETTITPSNKASFGLFESLAREHGAQVEVNTLFPSKLLSTNEQDHEEEQLVRIAPLRVGQGG